MPFFCECISRCVTKSNRLLRGRVSWLRHKRNFAVHAPYIRGLWSATSANGRKDVSGQRSHAKSAQYRVTRFFSLTRNSAFDVTIKCGRVRTKPKHPTIKTIRIRGRYPLQRYPESVRFQFFYLPAVIKKQKHGFSV